MPSRFLFVLTDGGHARLVARSPADGRYRTLEEIDGGPALATLRAERRAGPPGRTHSSTSPRRSAVGPEDLLRGAKQAFIAKVAERALEIGRARDVSGLVIAAPARLIGPLRETLDGRAVIAGAIRKDLTRTPDSRLGEWLNEAFSNPSLAR